MPDNPLAVIVLAAGKGTRMKSVSAKVLHPLKGQPLLSFVLESLKPLQAERVLVVVGYQADAVKSRFAHENIECVLQEEQLGTGHAVQQAELVLKDFEGDVLVLCGDMPLVKSGTLLNLLDTHRKSFADCTLLVLKTTELKDFGRIVRDPQGQVIRIVENKDCDETEKTIDEYNAGIYCFNNCLLFKALSSLGNDNAQKEYYLTDTIQYMVNHQHKVVAEFTNDADEILGINTLDDLKRAEQIVKENPEQFRVPEPPRV